MLHAGQAVWAQTLQARKAAWAHINDLSGPIRSMPLNVTVIVPHATNGCHDHALGLSDIGADTLHAYGGLIILVG
jgi:hypothetical protein